MPFPRDRDIHILEQKYPAFPLPPLNMYVSSGFRKGVVDIRWTSPAEINSNTCFDLIGVNVYRSFDSEFGPYFRLNTLPVGSTFWRDATHEVVALQEDVSGSFTARGPESDPAGRYMFRTKHKPIVIHPSPGSANCTNLNVQVTVNGAAAFVETIYADQGIVELRKTATFDVASQEMSPPVLPTGSSDVVLATYRYVRQEVVTRLAQRIFYRITTVARDDTGALIETPLNRAAQSANLEVEKLDWIWAEAVRRNRWIRDQGAERVKVFIRRAVGHRCGCHSDLHKQASSDCRVCFGTGILGGYDGPYDVTIAPDDSEKRITQTNRGRTVEHTYETWTGPSPLLSQRDFIVKLNGDRYGIGAVRMPSNRGMILQQHFPIQRLDEADVRYAVPIPDPRFLAAPQTRYQVKGEGGSTPMVTEKKNILDEREIRGNTVTFENHEY
jgi:hypothetical protein